jgi:hypothetical protein
MVFDNFAYGHNKKITKEIINAPADFKIGLIRAFFDDEGHVDRLRGPRFHQENLQILSEIRKIIEELGVKCCTNHHFIKRGKKRYFFNINGRKNYEKYYNVIGYTSSNKHNTLKILLNIAKE